MLVYKTTNLVNGKIYVGKTERSDLNYFGSGLLIRRAIKKYGVENFVRETLQECSTLEELNLAEIFWIWELGSTERSTGYNIASGGSGGKTRPHPWNLGLKEDPAITALRASKLRGRKQSQETIQKRNATLKGIKRSELTNFKHRLLRLGVPLSEETKRKLSQTRKAQALANPEIGRARIERAREFSYSEEANEKRRSSLKQYRQDQQPLRAQRISAQYPNLSEIVARNFSLADVLRELGLEPYGADYLRMRRNIQLLALDCSHFNQAKSTKRTPA